jgi:UDP-N-acetylmuramyl pentapeptide synthase
METLKYIVASILSWQARRVLARAKPRIVAVTGNLGKTSTKDAIYSALAPYIPTRKSSKSFNSELGIPLTILGLETGWNNPFIWCINILKGFYVAFVPNVYPEVLVLEVGADHPGDIQKISKWLFPDVAVITGIPDIPVHVEYFESPEAVAREKQYLAEAVKVGGLVLLNADDARSFAMRDVLSTTIKTFGMGSYATYFASDVATTFEDGIPVGVGAQVGTKDSTVPLVMKGVLGGQQIYPCIVAVAVADYFGISQEQVVAAMASHEPAPGRMRIVPGVHGSILVDDSYNSSPSATLAGLDTLSGMAGRRIAVLGDMLELGKYATTAHKKVGAHAVQCCDELYACGVRARGYVEGAEAAGMKELHIHHYDKDEQGRAIDALQGDVKKGDVVYIKGSQGARMERIVKALMAEPEKAEELLVRQNDEWLKR